MQKPQVLVVVITGLSIVAMLSCASGKQPVSSEILNSYLSIQTTLANDQIDGIGLAATTLISEADKLGMSGRDLKVAAVRFEEVTKNLQAARTAFVGVSDALIAYSDEFSDDVRVAFCPMIRQSWVQQDGEITNPYYGSQMLRCGSFVD